MVGQLVSGLISQTVGWLVFREMGWAVLDSSLAGFLVGMAVPKTGKPAVQSIEPLLEKLEQRLLSGLDKRLR